MGFTPDSPATKKDSFTPDAPTDSFKADESVLDRVKDPDRWQAILTGTGPKARTDVVQGYPPMIAPAGALPKAVQGIASLLNKNAVGRFAANTGLGAAQGAMKDPEPGESRGENAFKGGAIGASISSLGELLAAGGKGISAGYRALSPAPKEAWDARRASVLNEPAPNKYSPDYDPAAAPVPKQVQIEPEKYLGANESIDHILKGNPEFYAGHTYDQPPASMTVPATDLDQIRRSADGAIADSRASYKAGTTAPDNERYVGIAGNARGLLHDLSPDADKFYNDYSAQIKTDKAMKSARQAMSQGETSGAARVYGSIPAMAATKGAARSMSNPRTPFESLPLEAILQHILQKDQK